MSEDSPRPSRKRWGAVQSPLISDNSDPNSSYREPDPKTPKGQIKKALRKKIRSTMDFQQIDSNVSTGDPKSSRKLRKKLVKKPQSFDYLPDIDVLVTSGDSSTLKKKKRSRRSKVKNNNSSPQEAFNENKENDLSDTLKSAGDKNETSESSVEFRIKSSKKNSLTHNSKLSNITEGDKGLKVKCAKSKKSSVLLGENKSTSESDSVEFKFRDEPMVSVSKSIRRRRNVPLLRQQCLDESFSLEENKKVETVTSNAFIENANSSKPDKTGDTENSFDFKEILDVTNIQEVNLSWANTTGLLKCQDDNSPEKKTDGTYEISPQKSFLRQTSVVNLSKNSTYEISPSKSILQRSNFDFSDIGSNNKTPKKTVRITDFDKNTPVFNLRTSQVSTPHPKKSILKQKTPLLNFSKYSDASFEENGSPPKENRMVAFEEPANCQKVPKTVENSIIENIKPILRHTSGDRSEVKKKSLRLRESVEIIEDKKQVMWKTSKSPTEEIINGKSQNIIKTKLNDSVRDRSVRNAINNLSSVETNKANKSSVSFVGTPHPKNRSGLIPKKDKSNISMNKSNNIPVRTKIPNFTLIHQRAYEKMENIGEMQKRKNARAQLLLSGHKPVVKDIVNNSVEKQSKKVLNFANPSTSNHNNSKTNASKKKVRTSLEKKRTSLEKKRTSLEKKKQVVTSSRLPKVVTNEKKGYTRFGFKVGKPEAATKDDQIKAIAGKSKVRQNTTETKRVEVKGVRLNKRFELLMKMRNNNK